ncbi:MAG: cysteine dioxygenase [Odoribacteraceae bacterium]|jgi:hypothetical protein|nr:cysteine dioxygenase [Odoribacteraceae bacterium]
MKTILNATRKIEIIPGYEKIFEELLSKTAGKPVTTSLGEELKPFAENAARQINPADFQEFVSPYTRNYIGRDEQTGWEMIVMGWRKGDRTAIHGHPLYAGYTGVAGNVLLEVFKKVDGGLKKVLEHVVQPGESFYSVGEVEDFENHIHRLTGLTDTAFTLHVYSADARKGIDFDNFKIVD